MSAEFRRKCRRCGKVWHSLCSREEQLVANSKAGFCGFCFDLLDSNEHKAAVEIREGQRNSAHSELFRLHQCPECSSTSYDQEVLED